MKKIQNVKTRQSSKQENDKILALKSKKKYYLKNTDWTQINDVRIKNNDEIKKWRKRLRDFDIDDLSYEQSEKELEKIISEMPMPIIGKKVDTVDKEKEYNSDDISTVYKELKTIKENISTIYKELDNDNEIIELEEQEFRNVILKLFTEDANKLLMENGILEYNLMTILLEEAIDRQFSDDSYGPLLDQYLESLNSLSLEEIISNCRSFFKNINGLYTNIAKQRARMYNMSIDSLNNWCVENGHRYRCYNND